MTQLVVVVLAILLLADFWLLLAGFWLIRSFLTLVAVVFLLLFDVVVFVAFGTHAVWCCKFVSCSH